MRSNNFGGREIAIIALLLFIFAAIASNEFLPILFIAAAVYALARMYDNSQRNANNDTRDSVPLRRERAPDVVPSRSASAETVYRHALERYCPSILALSSFAAMKSPRRIARTPYPTTPITCSRSYSFGFRSARQAKSASKSRMPMDRCCSSTKNITS
jgi:hypothetical protein